MFAEEPIQVGRARSWQASQTYVYTGMGEKQKKYTKIKTSRMYKIVYPYYLHYKCVLKNTNMMLRLHHIFLVIKSNTAYQKLIKQKNRHLSFIYIHFPTIMYFQLSSPHHGEGTSRHMLINEKYSD